MSQRPRGFGRRGQKSALPQKKEWVPITRLGRMVNDGLITSIEEIFMASLPIMEVEIVDHLLPDLSDEVLKVQSVQKQTRAGQRTRQKAIVAVGDGKGHVGLGIKCSKEAVNSMREAVSLAKLNIVPVRKGYWGNKIGPMHTVPYKVTGKCGSVLVRLIPAPRGTGLVAAIVPQKLLRMCGLDDCYTCTRGATATLANFAKAIINALEATMKYRTPEHWKNIPLPIMPFQHDIKT